LVVVQHRLTQPFAQQPLDLEALGSGEVLELNGAKREVDARDQVGDLFRPPLLEQDRHR
jgi:hypothetical protein